MRLRVIAPFAVVLVCFAAAGAQVVNEQGSSASFGEKGMTVTIAYEHSGPAFDTRMTLELLDKYGIPAASAHRNFRIRDGRRTLSLLLSLEDLPTDDQDDLIWYRIRYRLGQSYGIVSLSELLKDFFDVSVTAPEYIKAGQSFKVRVRTIEPFKKTPVTGVDVKASFVLDLETDEDDDELTLEAAGKTDANGLATFDFAIPAGIVIDYANDLTVTATKHGFTRIVEADLDDVGNEGSVFITIDKPIYQPGQSFNVRALVFDSNRAVISGGELEFAIYDEEDTLLFRETVESSEYGVASVSWAIPDNAKLGNYRVEIEADDDVNGGSQRFKVTRYDLPNFTVTAKPDKSFYLPGDSEAAVDVSADYLFGKPVTKGSIRVVLEKERKWNWNKQAYEIDADQTVEGETGQDGSFTAKIDLRKHLSDLEKSSWRRFEDLHLAAYFTDLSSNRTEQRRFDIRITKERIHLYLMTRERNFNGELPVAAYLSAFYADGTPAECDVTIEGKNDDDENAVFAELARSRTNRLGAGKLTLFRPRFERADDDLALRITASDGKGAMGTFEDTLYFDGDPVVSVTSDKAIYKPGEPVRLSILSTLKDPTVFVDVVKEWSVVKSLNIELSDGAADIALPYDPSFSGELEIWAYTEYTDEDDDLEIAKSKIGVIFPKQQNLLLDTRFTSDTYKPNEEAKVSFAVKDGSGNAAQSALGVVVFDKAIEERARTDAEFGSYFGRFNDWMGYSRRFGSITLKDLNDLDLSKPVEPEVQLAAELVLASGGTYYYPQAERSEIDLTHPAFYFREYFRTQFGPVEKALKLQYENDHTYPVDLESMNRILSKHGIRVGSLTDPWGSKYRAGFSVRGRERLVFFESPGADKKFGTKDDFSVSSSGFEYFRPIGIEISRAAGDLKDHTGQFIRDLQSLTDVLHGRGVDLEMLRDPWGREYRFKFTVYGRNFRIDVDSSGPDGKWEEFTWRGDDINLWTTYTDFFTATEIEINRILSQEANDDAWVFPESEEAFAALLSRNGLDVRNIRDGYGRPVYLNVSKRTRYADKETIVGNKRTLTPVTEEIVYVELRSAGADGFADSGSNASDDVTLATFSSVLTQRFRDLKRSRATLRTIAYTGSNGAITGTVRDPTGAVIPAATVTASNDSNGVTKTDTTNDKGVFLIENLPTGSYRLEAESPNFQKMVYSDIKVKAYSLTELEIFLEVGGVTATVDVQSAVEVTVNTSMAMVSTTSEGSTTLPGTGIQMETPRLREYFPETLVWAPEVITDEKGNAELKFKMADNITTWKMYTVASTKNGKIGISEKEVQAFQPFFADLEPPKFLTAGDEIHLPVQIRNYTPSTQPVSVTMASSDWFSFLGESRKQIEVAPNASANAVFGFRAERAVDGGKQRVTALARDDSDAIEKPVTVRPNGREMTSSDSRLFSGSAEFAFDYPAGALEEGRSARLKIYPNLLANVADSVEGLLQRPYGCGEQTISSTYPNLMILKAAPEKSALRADALKFLRKGYERLLGYQASTGGFTYWGREGSEDISLTAYALRFLKDASGTIPVDQDVIRKAEHWLLSQQGQEGTWTVRYSWEKEENRRRTKMITSYVARSLAMNRDPEVKPGDLDIALQKALAYLKQRNEEIDEPYSIALYGLASLDAGYADEATAVAARLAGMAIPEGNSVYWNLETNTPFYGWGTAGRIETTALVVQLLERAGGNRSLAQKGTMFLIRNKDRYGVWYSTQTTINVLDAFLSTLGKSPNSAGERGRTAEIFVNGRPVRTVPLPPADELAPAIDLNLSSDVGPIANKVEIRISDDSDVMAQSVGIHYIDWSAPAALDAQGSNLTASRLLELDYSCDRTDAEIMENVTCSVSAERVGFRGYGMLLAEIGIPPGAEVSRESLERALETGRGFSRYEVLPDRIVFYMWAYPGGTKFDFSFRPRYAINAQTPASVVYDYYNDEAKAVVAPLKFNVKRN